ncbi:MAG: indole-3-glycerol phosphate synthase TrpC [Alistipes sp.]|jgi:indole-3-glycerol phosphate synthase|nr:indole-3-glycerol phosphate synthase TrpC [Alistipes sp.]
MTILDKILETKRAEVAASRRAGGLDDILAAAREVTRPVVSFSEALAASTTGIIAEFKRRSPSRGFINEGADVAAVVAGYAGAGAAAISVLTDRDWFAGSLDDLRAARRAAPNTPLLRKDFVVDEYQICEARTAGADAVLLIAAALSPERCAELAAFAAGLGLEVLLELHDESELGHVCDGVSVVGINNRDLATFVTDTALSERMAPLLPRDAVRISESGISSPATVRRLRENGFRGFLMGENFMKQPDPAAALRGFINELRSC